MLRFLRLASLTFVALTLCLGTAFATTPFDIYEGSNLRKIVQRGTLVVGMELKFWPFEYVDAQGKPVGFDVDIARTVAERLGVKLEIKDMACPCRLASGDFALDRDVICPCVYREPDVAEHGACFCGLYLSKALHAGGPGGMIPPGGEVQGRQRLPWRGRCGEGRCPSLPRLIVPSPAGGCPTASCCFQARVPRRSYRRRP